MEAEMRSRWLSPACVVGCILLLGLGLRSYHYLRNRAVWQDEAVVVVNVLERDFTTLLGPLRLHCVSPPLFLWVIKGSAVALGDSPFALRFGPFLASCAALLLFWPVARHFLSEEAVPWALLLFACSEQLLWHCCEAKPYAIDVFVSVLVLALATRLRETNLTWWLLGLAALAPVLILLSYPACFVLGGALLAVVPAVLRARRLGPALAFGLFALSTGAAFLVLTLGPVRLQHDAVLSNEWVSCLPDWSHPLTVPVWTVLSTFEVWRYCCKPLGQVLLVVSAVGAVAWWRGGRRAALVLCLAPIGLALLASYLHRYPYGGVRVMAYAAPAIMLLVAAGAPLMLAWLRRWGRLAWTAGLLVLLLPVTAAVERLVFPWHDANIAEVAEYLDTQRRPDDEVVGNDWTHLYYFRHLGGSFHFSDTLPSADWPNPATGRVWVVVTIHDRNHQERIVQARGLAPAGWVLGGETAFRDSSVGVFHRQTTPVSQPLLP
jgi:hypothetical protein